jgi:Secretion system C-terminal sorting domain
MRKLYIAFFLFLITCTGFAQTTYTWAVPTGNWTTPSSWNPIRTAPAITDILVFNGALVASPNITVDIVAQNISQLIFNNGCNATFTVPINANPTINLSNNLPGTDFFVSNNSKVLFTNIAGPSNITLNIKIGLIGQVDGNIIFDGTATGSGAAHRLNTDDAGGLVFSSGSSITFQGNVQGNLFGTITDNSVVFQAGSKYISKAGANPFGATTTNSVVTFLKGSTYSHQQIASPSLSDRTYANFEVDISPTQNTTTFSGNSPFRCDTFKIINAGIFRLKNDGGMIVSGDFIVQNGSFFFSPQLISSILFNGSVPQNISGNFSIDNTGGGVDRTKIIIGSGAVVNMFTNLNTNDSVSVFGKLNTNNNVVSGGYFYLAPDDINFNFIGSILSGSDQLRISNTSVTPISAGMRIEGQGLYPNTYVMKCTGGTAYLSKPSMFGFIQFYTVFTTRATLGLGRADGLINPPNFTCNIQSSLGISVTPKANYEYNGSLAQNTGNGLPASVKNLIINNSASANVNLTKSVFIDDTLSLQKGFLTVLGSSAITLRDTTEIKSPNNNYNIPDIGYEGSFVKGKVQAEVSSTTDKWFPIGKSAGANNYFAPVRINKANITPVVYDAEYFATSFIPNNNDASLDHVSGLEYWRINSSVANNNSDAKITLSWRPSSKVGNGNPANDVQALDDLLVSQLFDNDGPFGPNPFAFGIIGNSGTTKSAGSTVNYGTLTTIDNLSPYNATSTNPIFTLGTKSPFNVLPLKFVEFVCKENKGNVEIKWTTKEENLLLKYQVQSSIDGNNFNSIADVNAKNDVAENLYSHVDKFTTTGWRFYRLKIFETNGKITYSPIIKLWVGSTSQLLVYPNPAKKEIKINFKSQSSIYTIAIVNSGGEIVKQITTLQPFTTVNLESLSSGTYFIRIHSIGQTIVQRFIKL